MGFHSWINIDNAAPPDLLPGQSMYYSELHQCKRCGKKDYLGMGWLM